MEAFGDFFKDFMRACQHEPEAGYIPVVVTNNAFIWSKFLANSQFNFSTRYKFMDPVYGQKDTTFTEFMAPGLIIS